MREILAFILLPIFTLVAGDACPIDYTQSGGNCFQLIYKYDSFSGTYYPYTFDDAEQNCNARSGGLLASIHSEEENTMAAHLSCPLYHKNIGLKCHGLECKWDDGSPMTYENFYSQSKPKDDGRTRCYGIDYTTQWVTVDCGKETDCWVCSVKAKTFDCVEGETEWKGGCASVHTAPLDQKSAEAACPNGGRLVSIHHTLYGDTEFYMNLALSAGIKGTVYLGGHFINGLFAWSDGSYTNIANWAAGFPDTYFGFCVQMLLASEFGNQGQWTNIDCATKLPYFCYREGPDYGTPLEQGLAPSKCPPIQYFTESGTIYSPNYPVSIPGQQRCEYAIATAEGTKASVKFPAFDCQSGTTLEIYDGLNGNVPVASFTTNAPSPSESYVATSSVLKLVFSTEDSSAPIGTGWQAEFVGV